MSLPVRSAMVLMVLAILFILSLGACLMWLLLHQVSDDDMTALEQENTLLRDSVGDLNAQIDSVQARLELMEDWEERIRRDDNLRHMDDVLLDDPSGYTPGFESPVDEDDETEN